MVILLFALWICLVVVNSIHLPGVGPQLYKTDDDVPLLVSKITSTKTQMPYDYYSLPFCRPKKFKLRSENVGEALEGDRIEASLYDVKMRKEYRDRIK